MKSFLRNRLQVADSSNLHVSVTIINPRSYSQSYKITNSARNVKIFFAIIRLIKNKTCGFAAHTLFLKFRKGRNALKKQPAGFIFKF